MGFDRLPGPSGFRRQLRERHSGVTSSRHACPQNRLQQSPLARVCQETPPARASEGIGDASSTIPPPMVTTGEN